MTKAAKQLFEISVERLGKLVGQGTHSGAKAALDRAQEILETGGRPVIYYSDFNGFTVLDNNSNDPSVSQHLVSMQQRSKPFPG